MVKPEQLFDVAILGAGPAGLAAAAELGKTGLSVALIDSGQSQKNHQVESFPESGAPLAEATGLLGPICSAAYAPASTMLMHWRAKKEAREFGPSGPLLLHRRELHNALLAHALSISSSTQWINAKVRDRQTLNNHTLITTDSVALTARVVLEARGRVETRRLNRGLNRGMHKCGKPDKTASTRVTQKETRQALVSLPFSVGIANRIDAGMYLEALADGWVWAASTGDGQLHGAVFQYASTLAGMRQSERAAYGSSCLDQCGCIPQANTEPVFYTPGAANFDALADPVISDTCFAIGDAALARDPVASHGLVHALRSGVQAAAVVRTILSSQHPSDAAYAFLRHKHEDACRHAMLATARAYADQQRFNTAFWQRFSPPEPQAQPLSFAVSDVLTLSEPMTRAPILAGDTISWAPAIYLPLHQDYASYIGKLSATDIGNAVRPAAAMPEIAARLQRSHDHKTVTDALKILLDSGALTPVWQGNQSNSAAQSAFGTHVTEHHL